MTSFTVSIRDVAQRHHEIEEKARSSIDTRPFYKLHTGNDVLPVVQLDIRLPLYRMANYRTQTKQFAYVRTHELPADFFSAGQEDAAAQQAQHGILVDLAAQGSGDTIIPIVKALQQDNKQTEPLLITREGVVVNGNRRLAAMREMFADEPGQHPAFAAVDALVLPASVTQDELRRVEFRLQMQPQTQLPYDWTNRALAVRDLRTRNTPANEIASLMRLEKDSEVAAMIEQLAEAEIFLDEYLARPGDYELVDGQEQLFGDLQLALRGKKTAEEKESSRRIAHVMAKHSRAFGSRIYDYKGAFGSKTDDVMKRLALRYGVGIGQTAANVDEDDVFGGAAQDEYSQVRALLKKDDISEALANHIREVFDEIREESKEQDAGLRALKNCQKANTALADVFLLTADPSTLKDIRIQLTSVSKTAQSLLNELEERREKARARRRKR